ncbi:DUF4232 domain-containing protein [Streptomyces sp. WAC06614]|uniref:DUF4232 domain-containing protein n=1 Tax=Streptomyces sp. WAC06614 TaxID=2487416 RepID=UPI000F7ABD7D|nr:DUF4232 domain-containing protein [Streptomyces sp. WAC06614]RSS75547.1 DUF4232 domain-containing protein [Streptomyces sp. WAC06614]
MPVPVRPLTSAAAVLLAGLALSGCGHAGTASGSATASGGSGPSRLSELSGGADLSGVPGPSGAPSAESAAQDRPPAAAEGPGAVAIGAARACTTANTRLVFVASAHHAGPQQPATAVVQLTNTSGTTCTMVGAVVLTARDDRGRAAPVVADTTGSGTDTVDVRAGATAQASVSYTDVTPEGGASGRDACPVSASRVEIALPNDEGRTVGVTDTDGSPGVFTVCGPQVRFDRFDRFDRFGH